MGKMDALMMMVTICKDYGWTYQEYQEQPEFFLRLIREKYIRDQKEAERELSQIKRGS